MARLLDRQGVRRCGVYAFSAVVGTVGLLVTVFAHEQHRGRTPFGLPWWVLVLAYLAAFVRPVQFRFRGGTFEVVLTQVPLCLGIIFLGPLWHLLARVVAHAVISGQRRLSPMKALFNVALGAVEVGIASGVVLGVSGDVSPRPLLWLTLSLGCLAGEAVAPVCMNVVLAMLGVTGTRGQWRSSQLSTALTSLLFSVLGSLTVAAAWSDRWSILLAGGLLIGLGIAYRTHQHLAQLSQRQSEVRTFVRGVGALDMELPSNDGVLDELRQLLGVEHLELSLVAGEGWVHHLSGGGVTQGHGESHLQPRDAVFRRDDEMSAPLIGDVELLGVLSVKGRSNSNRPYQLQDLHALETTAAELSKAIERGRLQRELHLAATIDPLTGLPNLHELSRRLDAWLSDEGALLLAAVAVDSFREVNDTLGHQVGDELLVEVTRRLRLSHPTALIGRIGGGRFAVAVAADSMGHDAALFGLGLRAQVEGGAQLGPVGTHIKLSVGCVTAPEHGSDAATLIRRSETAMYSARSAHGGPVVWAPAYEVEGQRRLAVVSALRDALSSGAIGVVFQPKVTTGSGQISGVEALARWTHPALGAVSPAEFIPLAEAAGLMGPLTSTVLRQAAIACQGWQRRGGRVGVAVNVSAETLLDPSFVTEVAAVITSVNLDPHLLTIELTEGVVLDDPQLASERMSELRALGVRISVDDFGTGYSSLTYLKGLPVDEVKIDKGFVDHLVDDAGDRAVVRAVVDIAHTLGLRVVAEGVEDADQDRLLAALGVDEVQGYLHARPMPALDMASWLRRREVAAPRV